MTQWWYGVGSNTIDKRRTTLCHLQITKRGIRRSNDNENNQTGWLERVKVNEAGNGGGQSMFYETTNMDKDMADILDKKTKKMKEKTTRRM